MYKFFFLSIFFISRLVPYGVLIFASNTIDEKLYIFLENSIATATLLATIIGLGLPNVITIVEDNKKNNFIISLHIILSSTFLILLCGFLFYSNNDYLNIIIALVVYFLINSTLITHLKINNRRILPLILETVIYVIIFFIIIQSNFYNYPLKDSLKNIYFIFAVSFIFVFIFVRKSIFNFKLLKLNTNELNYVYSKGLNILLCNFIMLSFILYPRILIIYFDELQKFQYLLNFRIAFLGMIMHQITANYFFRNFFKDDLKSVINLSIISGVLTLLLSIITVLIYILLRDNFFEFLKIIEFNFMICLQIFLISIVGFTNLILIRIKLDFKKLLIIAFTIFTIFILTYFSANYLTNNVDLLIFYHLFFGIYLVYITVTNLTKKLKKKNEIV